MPNVNELFTIEDKRGPTAFITPFDNVVGKMFKGQVSE